MKAIAFNGSARKTGNTATLLQKALEGAAGTGAETELVHLHAHTYKSCISCLSCKKLAGKSYGRCAIKDDLTPLLEKAAEADILILGSPIYFGTETGALRSFMERLLYPFYPYANEPSTLFPRRIQTALIYTMGQPESTHAQLGYNKLFERTSYFMDRVFGPCELFVYGDARLFADPGNYFCPSLDAAKKQAHYEQMFPLECDRAFALGKKMASAR